MQAGIEVTNPPLYNNVPLGVIAVDGRIGPGLVTVDGILASKCDRSAYFAEGRLSRWTKRSIRACSSDLDLPLVEDADHRVAEAFEKARHRADFALLFAAERKAENAVTRPQPAHAFRFIH